MSSSLLFTLAMAMGFSLAGATGELYRLMTHRRISFELADVARPQLVLGFFVLMLAGPAVIMRNAIRGRVIEDRALHWLVLSSVIAGMWSFLAGITLIHGLGVFNS